MFKVENTPKPALFLAFPGPPEGAQLPLPHLREAIRPKGPPRRTHTVSAHKGKGENTISHNSI